MRTPYSVPCLPKSRCPGDAYTAAESAANNRRGLEPIEIGHIHATTLGRTCGVVEKVTSVREHVRKAVTWSAAPAVESPVTASPPVSAIRKIGRAGPELKRMPRPGSSAAEADFDSDERLTLPPSTSRRLSRRSAKNPTDRPSGDQNGYAAKSVPGSGRAAVRPALETRAVRRPSNVATNTTLRPSGEISSDIGSVVEAW